MRKFFGLIFAAFLISAAHAQSVQQSGTVTATHVPAWVFNGIIGDGGTASDSPITTLGVTSNSTAGFCVSSGRSTAAGRQQLCLGAPLSASAVISLQNYGTATAQGLSFIINGTTVTIPTGGAGTLPTITTPTVANNPICASDTSGTLVDCTNGTNGQVWLGQTGAVPTWTTLSGDVSTVSAGGAVTLGSVNGVTFDSTYTAHGILVAQGTSAFTTVTSANIGYCLLSQGTSSDPIYAPCSSGSGTAGGANTEVQYNNSSSLAGSVNLTWVSPTLTIGVNTATTGQLALASSNLSGQSVVIQNPSTTSTYNFNLPTSAGTSGQPLLSGGGGSTAMSFGTLDIAGGGTNCTSASGTCVDNISGWSSTGYINRTGAGTYAFAGQIPVSGGGTGLASGTSGGILGFTASGTIASSAALTSHGIVYGGGAGATPASTAAGTDGQLLLGQTSAAPVWASVSGDLSSISAAGAVTIANSAVTNAKLADSAAYTLKGNFTGSSAAPQDSTLGALTNKASPAAGDYVLIADNAASGQLKYALVSAIASAGSVSAIDSQTGAFTTANGITSTATANTIELTAARRTLPTTQVFTTGSGTYTTPANVLWIEITLVGGGSGGGGGNNGVTNSTAGGASCWNTTGAACTSPVYSAGGGSASSDAAAGAGGTISGSSTCTWSVPGGVGSSGGKSFNDTVRSLYGLGGSGGNSTLGGAGPSTNTTGGTAATNTGSGGGGGATSTAADGNPAGWGGSSGATCYAIITSPAASYTYAVGAGGAGAAAGTNGSAGGAGATGHIVVIEHYGT